MNAILPAGEVDVDDIQAVLGYAEDRLMWPRKEWNALERIHKALGDHNEWTTGRASGV